MHWFTLCLCGCEYPSSQKKYSFESTILGLFQKSRGSNHKSIVNLEFSLELVGLGLFLKNVV